MEDKILTVSYRAKGTLDKERISDFFEQMEAIASEDRKIHLVLEVYCIDSLRNLNGFFSAKQWKPEMRENLKKFALIADADWMNELSDFIDCLTPKIEVNIFDFNERKKAKAWANTAA